MSANTAIEGYPYPLTSDFADVQDVYRLATAIDTDLRSEQAPFRAFLARPSFIARQAANSSTFLSGSQTLSMTAIEWDNTGGAIAGNSFWTQPFSQPPSWWLFGSTIMLNNAATGVVADLVMAQLAITTADQVTGVQTTSQFFQRNDETSTGGEWLNVFAMAPIYQGSAGALININGTSLKGIGAGSRLWGMYLGPVT
jgi:hypothetical protein